MEDRFLLDSNIFIDSKNFAYRFEYCQMFWDFLLKLHNKKIVYSINAVKKELLFKTDELSYWIKNTVPSSFFEDEMSSIDCYGTLMNWAQNQKVTEKAKTDFANPDKADAFLIAHAMKNNYVIVTGEKFDENVKKRIMIPNAANAHNVRTITLFDFLISYAGHNFSLK